GTVAHGLVDRLAEEMLQQDAWGGWGAPRALVHHLEPSMTGLMAVAKTEAGEHELPLLLRADGACSSTTGMGEGRCGVKQVYVALLLGHPGGADAAADGSKIWVQDPIGPDPDEPSRQAVSQMGQDACSVVRVHRFSADHSVALATIELRTARMHQGRVHCAHLGTAVACDSVYGERGGGFGRWWWWCWWWC
ncbi:unnamed protein product, partial [Polarella glacialis]